MAVVPITGQPGLFRSTPRPTLAEYLDGGGFHGAVLGDFAALQIQQREAAAKFSALRQATAALIAPYGPLDQTTWDRIKAAVQGKTPSFFGTMGVATFAGLVRTCLERAALNLNLSQALLNAPSPSVINETFAATLISTAKNLLDAVEHLVITMRRTEAEIASLIRQTETTVQRIAQQIGLAGHPGLGLEPIEIGAGIVVVFIIATAVYLCVTQYEAAQAGAAAADAACNRPGVSCTAEQYAQIRQEAMRASQQLTLLPDIGRAIQEAASAASSALFWGGLLIVGGLLAYGAWVTAPAAAITRERLTTRARAMNGLGAMYLRRGMTVYAPGRHGDRNAGGATVLEVLGDTVKVEWDNGNVEWIPTERIKRVERMSRVRPLQE